MNKSELVVGFGVIGGVINIDGTENRANGSSQYKRMLQVLLDCPNVKNVVVHSRFSHKTEKIRGWETLNNWEKIIYPTEMTLRIGKHIWKGTEFFTERQPYGCEPAEFWRSREYCDLYAKYCIEKVPTCDFGLFFISMSFADTNIPKCLHKANGSPYYKCQTPSMHRQTAPFLHYLNISSMPHFYLATDDRIITRKWREDCINLPLEIIGQWNASYFWNTMPSYSRDRERVKRELTVTYGHVQKLNMIGVSEFVDPSTPREYGLTVVANQTTYSNDSSCPRFKFLQEWVLEQIPNSFVIGDWDRSFKCNFRSSNAKEMQAFNKEPDDPKDYWYKQFIGKMSSEETDKILVNSKYSLCIPCIPGYLTSKVYEVLSLGTLPFIPPMYDEQFNAIEEDSLLRVRDAKDLLAKIELFDSQPKTRISVVKEYQKLMLSNLFDGTFIKVEVNKRCRKFGLPELL